MKRILITAALILGMSVAFGQRQSTVTKRAKVGYVTCKRSTTVNHDDGFTLECVRMTFQNYKYSRIVDIRSVSIYNQDELDQFIIDLENAAKSCKSKSTIYWNRSSYNLYCYDFSYQIYLSPKDGRGYTKLTAKQCLKLAAWLKTIKL